MISIYDHHICSSFMMIIHEDYQPKRYKVIFRLIFNRFQQFLRQIRCNCDPESIIGAPGPRINIEPRFEPQGPAIHYAAACAQKLSGTQPHGIHRAAPALTRNRQDPYSRELFGEYLKYRKSTKNPPHLVRE